MRCRFAAVLAVVTMGTLGATVAPGSTIVQAVSGGRITLQQFPYRSVDTRLNALLAANTIVPIGSGVLSLTVLDATLPGVVEMFECGFRYSTSGNLQRYFSAGGFMTLNVTTPLNMCIVADQPIHYFVDVAGSVSNSAIPGGSEYVRLPTPQLTLREHVEVESVSREEPTKIALPTLVSVPPACAH